MKFIILGKFSILKQCFIHVPQVCQRLQWEMYIVIEGYSISKVPLLWLMKGSYFGFGSLQQQADMHARSKNTFIVL